MTTRRKAPRAAPAKKRAAAGAYPRDLVGYGRKYPHPGWPGGARIAVQIVLNYEEGAENNILHGDQASETFLSEIIGAHAFPNRHMSMESMYEYGSRIGAWRVLREFERRKLPLTVFGVAMALERNPDLAAAMVEAGHEIASHGWRWISYQMMDEKTEREHIRARDRDDPAADGRQVAARLVHRARQPEHAAPGGRARRLSLRRRLLRRRPAVLGEGRGTSDQLVVPYTLDTNDMRFATDQGFNTGDQFFSYVRDAFDVLYAEGLESAKMMSIGLHCRLIGRPGRFRGLQRFLDYAQNHESVWFCRRIDIARHWREKFPPARG